MKIVSKPVEMIALFGKDGKAVPLRFRIIEEEGGEPQTICVAKVICETSTKMGGMESLVFQCQSEIAGEEKRYEIKYRIGDHRWELYKA